MKRGNSGAIASLFQKHEAKRIAAVVIDVQAEDSLGPGSENLLQISDSAPQLETDSAPPSPHLPSGSSADTYLPFDCDPGKRIPISSYDVNDQDDVRRRYIAKGGYRSYAHDFQVRKMFGRNRHFSCVWFEHYRLLKLVLVLPVATASVERVFSAMSLVKNKLRNSLGDDLLNYCLVTFIERELFLEVKEEDIVGSFMAMRRRRVDS